MNIGIIGAGHIGGTLAHRFTQLGHKVKVANSRGPETLRDLASESGATPVELRDAVRDVQLVVVTIPMKNLRDLPKDLFAHAPADLIVVDTCNYYPQQRDGKIAEIEDGGIPESQYVESQIGHSVIKAFNNIYAQHLLENGRPPGSPDRIALPVAGDDPVQKRTVMDLVDQLGFDPVDDGTIADSWRQQPGSPCYAKDYDKEALSAALSAAHKERSPEWRVK